MRWVGKLHHGRQLLFRPEDGGRMRVKAGRFVPEVRLKPDSGMVRRESRHPPWMAGIDQVQRTIVTEDARLAQNPELPVRYRYLGEERLLGSRVLSYEADLPKNRDPAAYASSVRVSFSADTGIIVAIRAWDVEDGAMRQVEDYGYAEQVINAGLRKEEFDPRVLKRR